MATNAEVAEELNAYAAERAPTFTGGGIWGLCSATIRMTGQDS